MRRQGLTLALIAILAGVAFAQAPVCEVGTDPDFNPLTNSLIWGSQGTTPATMGRCWDKEWLLDYSFSGYRMGQQNFGAGWRESAPVYLVTDAPYNATAGAYRADNDWFGIQAAMNDARTRLSGGDGGVVKMPAGQFDMGDALRFDVTGSYVSNVVLEGTCDVDGNPLTVLYWYIPQSGCYDEDNDGEIETDNDSMCDQDSSNSRESCNNDGECTGGLCGIDECPLREADGHRCHQDSDTTPATNTNGDFCTVDATCGDGFCGPSNGFDGAGILSQGSGTGEATMTWSWRRGSSITLNLIRENEANWTAGALKQITANAAGGTMLRGDSRIFVNTGGDNNDFNVGDVFTLRIKDQSPTCNGSGTCSNNGYCAETCIGGFCSDSGAVCGGTNDCQWPDAGPSPDSKSTCTLGSQSNCGAGFTCVDYYQEGSFLQYLANWRRSGSSFGEYTEGQYLHVAMHRITAIDGARGWFDVEPALGVDIRTAWAGVSELTRVASVSDESPESWTYDANLLTSREIGVECVELRFPIYPHDGHHNCIPESGSQWCNTGPLNVECSADQGGDGDCPGNCSADGIPCSRLQPGDEESKGLSYFHSINTWAKNVKLMNIHGPGFRLRDNQHVTIENTLIDADLVTRWCDGSPILGACTSDADCGGGGDTEAWWNYMVDFDGNPGSKCASMKPDIDRNNAPGLTWGGVQQTGNGLFWEMGHHGYYLPRTSRSLILDSTIVHPTTHDYSYANWAHFNAVVTSVTDAGHTDAHQQGTWGNLVTDADFGRGQLRGNFDTNYSDGTQGIMVSSGFGSDDTALFGWTFWGLKTDIEHMFRPSKNPRPVIIWEGITFDSVTPTLDEIPSWPTMPTNTTNVRFDGITEVIQQGTLEPNNIWQAQYIKNFCGDGIVQKYEACDDSQAGVTCSLNCLISLVDEPLIYISSSGDNQAESNDCRTLGNPCLTFKHAFGQMVAGDTLIVIDGSVFDGAAATAPGTSCATFPGDIYIMEPKVGTGTCSAADPCRVRGQTETSITPQHDDLRDEVPTWTITDQGNQKGCLLIGDDQDYWEISGFECNTDKGIAICGDNGNRTTNTYLHDFILDASNNAVAASNGDGRFTLIQVEWADDGVIDNFRARGTTSNLETPAWVKEHGPGSTSAGTNTVKLGIVSRANNWTFSDFYWGHTSTGINSTWATNITLKRGSIMTVQNHGNQIGAKKGGGISSDFLIENVVFFHPDWGHCWDGSLSEGSKLLRDTKRATITNKRCRVDDDCSLEGLSDVCRVGADEFNCDKTNPRPTPADMTGYCGTCNEEPTCANDGTNIGGLCPNGGATDCGGGTCELANQKCALGTEYIAIYDGTDITVRNNTFVGRGLGSWKGLQMAHNTTALVSNGGALDTNCFELATIANGGGVCNGDPDVVCTELTQVADCDSDNCDPVCVWDNVKFYNNVFVDMDNPDSSGGVAEFVHIPDFLWYKIGDELSGGDYNYYAGPNPTWQCAKGIADVTTAFDTLAGWLIGLGPGGVCDPALDPIANSQTAFDSTLDHPIETTDANSFYSLEFINEFANYALGDYRPSAASILDGFGADGVDGAGVGRCATEDFFGASRPGGSCTPGAFLPATAVSGPPTYIGTKGATSQ